MGSVKGERYFFILHFRSLFCLPLLQFAEDAAHAGRSDVQLVAALVALMAVGAALAAAEVADGQFAPAAAADQSGFFIVVKWFKSE